VCVCVCVCVCMYVCMYVDAIFGACCDPLTHLLTHRDRDVTTGEGVRFAEEHSLYYWEVSSKTGLHVLDLIVALAK